MNDHEDSPLAPPRVKIGLQLPGATRVLTSVHFSGPGETLTLCRYTEENKTGEIVSCQPTEDKISCTACQRKVDEAKAKPGFGSAEHLAALQRGIALSALGVAGVTQKGGIVDRREVPDALPIPANAMLGVPKPLKLGQKLGLGGFIHTRGVELHEVGSDPAGETDCGKRGINHLMITRPEGIAECQSPGCNGMYSPHAKRL